MNLLTDDEIDAITDQQWDGIRGREIAAAHRAYARAIEAALLSKLTDGYVVPEPVHHIMSDGVSIGYYSLDQLQAYAAGRAAGLSAEPVAARWPSVPGSHHYAGAGGCSVGAFGPDSEDLFTLDQLTTAIAAARVQENERCLAMMDAIGCDWRDAGDMAKFYATNYLREAIRALLGKEQS